MSTVQKISQLGLFLLVMGFATTAMSAESAQPSGRVSISEQVDCCWRRHYLGRWETKLQREGLSFHNRRSDSRRFWHQQGKRIRRGIQFNRRCEVRGNLCCCRSRIDPGRRHERYDTTQSRWRDHAHTLDITRRQAATRHQRIDHQDEIDPRGFDRSNSEHFPCVMWGGVYFCAPKRNRYYGYAPRRSIPPARVDQLCRKPMGKSSWPHDES